MSDNSYIAERARRMRARRWLRFGRAVVLLALLAALPLAVFLLLADGEEGSDMVTSSTEPAEVLVRSFSGSGSRSTSVFVVSSEWVIKWTLDGLASDSLEITVRASDGSVSGSARQDGLGSGEQAFEESGAFRLNITTRGDWSIRVLQLASYPNE